MQNLGKLLIAVCFFLSLELRAAPPITSWNFDWDDNIFNMPTKIVLFDKQTGKELPVTTGEFANIRDKVGVSGKWRSFEIRKDNTTGSFRFFRDSPTGNYFLDDIQTALKTMKPEVWQAPAWKAFAEALSNPETASRVSIITARGHPPNEIMEGLQYLQKHRYLKHLPPFEKLHAVGGTENPSHAKVQVMRKDLDALQATAIRADTPPVMNAAGTSTQKMHLWGFSDDDYGNYQVALKELSKDIQAGKYPDVKVTLFYTGTHNPAYQPHAVVIRPDGTTRPFHASEMPETGPHRVVAGSHDKCSSIYEFLTKSVAH